MTTTYSLPFDTPYWTSELGHNQFLYPSELKKLEENILLEVEELHLISSGLKAIRLTNPVQIKILGLVNPIIWVQR